MFQLSAMFTGARSRALMYCLASRPTFKVFLSILVSCHSPVRQRALRRLAGTDGQTMVILLCSVLSVGGPVPALRHVYWGQVKRSAVLSGLEANLQGTDGQTMVILLCSVLSVGGRVPALRHVYWGQVKNSAVLSGLQANLRVPFTNVHCLALQEQMVRLWLSSCVLFYLSVVVFQLSAIFTRARSRALLYCLASRPTFEVSIVPFTNVHCLALQEQMVRLWLSSCVLFYLSVVVFQLSAIFTSARSSALLYCLASRPTSKVFLSILVGFHSPVHQRALPRLTGTDGQTMVILLCSVLSVGGRVPALRHVYWGQVKRSAVLSGLEANLQGLPIYSSRFP
ncbi:hypothetical protein J6590_025162 [Homalodisca vitripennis]|nr:hypothetical protein J6590_025162 [Homalodisca vitripennis]